MEDIISSLFVQSIRARLEACRVVAATLMAELESQRLTILERQAGLRRWRDVTRDGDTMELMLELVRRHEREDRAASSHHYEFK